MKKLKLLGLAFLVLAVSFLGFSGRLAQAATTYTLADVAAHHTSTDCWVAISGNVYNLTAFIPTHPGGAAAIIGLCGTDGTAALSAAPHGLSVVPTIASYMIGALATSTTPVLTSVSVVTASSSIVIGGTSQLAATPKDQNGALFVGATTTFTSGTPAVATVNSTTGLVTGVSAGTAVITASANSGSVTVTGTTTITVTSTTGGGGGGGNGGGGDDQNENENEHEGSGTGGHHGGGGSSEHEGGGTGTGTGGHTHNHGIDD